MLEQQPMPTKKLTEEMLKSQRDGFFKYICTVEKRGAFVLENLMSQGGRDGESTGWPSVHRILAQYLTLSNNLINECQDINIIIAELPKLPEPSRPERQLVSQEAEKRKGRKIDSGVSFNSEGRHIKTPSTGSFKSVSTHTSSSQVGKSGSALERITRELRRIRSKQRLEVTELIKPYAADDIEKENRPSTPKLRFAGLRKMRSLGDIKQHSGGASGAGRGLTAAHDPMPAFDPENLRRQKEAFERRARKPSQG